MGRRGNCYDNAVAGSFFSSLQKERIRRKIYATREEARDENPSGKSTYRFLLSSIGSRRSNGTRATANSEGV